MVFRTFSEFPATAAWRHGNSRTGFEATSFRRQDNGWVVRGSTTAVEDGVAWWVAYEIHLDPTFVTRRAVVEVPVTDGSSRTIRIDGDGSGRWKIDGAPAPHLDGCRDVDLESSALTNAFPVRRLGLAVDEFAGAPAVYVRVHDGLVERLEQGYTRREDEGSGPTFDYAAPQFAFACRITYDAAGLVLAYPDIADRIV